MAHTSSVESRPPESAMDDLPVAAAESGGMAGMLAALTVLALVAILAFSLIGTQGTAASAPGMTMAIEQEKPNHNSPTTETPVRR